MAGTAALYTFCNPGVKNVLKKIGHEPNGGQIVKSQKNKHFYNSLLLDKFKLWE